MWVSGKLPEDKEYIAHAERYVRVGEEDVPTPPNMP